MSQKDIALELTRRADNILRSVFGQIKAFNDLTRHLNELGWHQAPVIEGLFGERESEAGQRVWIGVDPEQCLDVYAEPHKPDPLLEMDRLSSSDIGTLSEQTMEPRDPRFMSITELRSRVSNRRSVFSRQAPLSTLVGRLGLEAEWICFYCRKAGSEEIGPDARKWHIDHVYPKVDGGDNGKDNLVLSCATCNLRKGRLMVSEFVAKLADSNA